MLLKLKTMRVPMGPLASPCSISPNNSRHTLRSSSSHLKKFFPISAKKRQKEKLVSNQSFPQRRETKT
jgi:hypothetical protein